MEKEQQLQTTCLLILTVIATATALAYLKPVMVPFILALLVTLTLTPIIDIQKKHLKFPHWLAVLISLAIGGVVVFLIGTVLSVSINQMLSNADSYQTKIIELVEKITIALNLERFGIDSRELIVPTLQNAGKSVGNMVLGTFNTVIGLFSRSILVFIFVLFLLIGGKNSAKPQSPSWDEGELRIKKYIITKLIISSATGILVALVLSIFNIDLALAFGLLAFILNFIPSVGSMIATLLPLPVILLTPEISKPAMIMAIAIPGVIQFAIGNVLEPKIMGDSIGLHPITILLALIFWGIIWGIVGMFLAVPLAVILKIIFSKIDYTRELATKM
ncbi:MAG: AI-2 transport protein TqsA [Lysobacterales bacterium]|jgi:AI-2 transport protein TqsA